MRLLYASQFEIEATAERLPQTYEAVNRCVSGWISDWYLTRASLNVTIPEQTGTVHPQPSHEIYRESTRLPSNYTAHDSYKWSYPDENDGNLLWHARIDIAAFAGLIELSLQISLDSTQFYIAPVDFNLGRPRIIATLLNTFTCVYGGGRLHTDPQVLTAATIPGFVQRRLYSGIRRLPIVVISKDMKSEKPIIDPRDLANKLCGIAEVFELSDKWASFALTDEIGKRFACFNGAVRIYWPDFNPALDPFSPVFLPRDLVSTDRSVPEKLFRTLSGISAFRFVPGPVITDALDAISDQKNRELEEQRAAARDRSDYGELLEIADKEISNLSDENGRLKEINEQLRQQLEVSQENLQSIFKTQGGDDSQIELPIDDGLRIESVFEAVSEAEKSFSNELEFLDRAVASAKESPFGQPEKVFRAFEAMAEVNRNWKASKKGKSVGSFEIQFQQKGFIYKAHESDTSKNKWKDEYEIEVGGKKYSIEQHLALGKGGPETCLRIHFYQDDSNMQFVIAHVGRHKTNTKT